MRLALSWTGLDVDPPPEAAEDAMKQDVSASLVADLVSMIGCVEWACHLQRTFEGIRRE
jgi:hypothetical protein